MGAVEQGPNSFTSDGIWTQCRVINFSRQNTIILTTTKCYVDIAIHRTLVLNLSRYSGFVLYICSNITATDVWTHAKIHQADGHCLSREGGFLFRFYYLLSSASLPPRSGLSDGDTQSRWLCFCKCRAKNRSHPNSVVSRGMFPTGMWKYLHCSNMAWKDRQETISTYYDMVHRDLLPVIIARHTA